MGTGRTARIERILTPVCIALMGAHVVVGLWGVWVANAQRELLAAGVLVPGSSDGFFLESNWAALGADAARLLVWDQTLVLLTALTFVPLFTHYYGRLRTRRRRVVWAWLGWVIPFANLFVPFRLSREIDAAARNQSAQGPASWVLFGWWIGWLGGRISGLLAGMAVRRGRLPDGAHLDMAAGALSALSALLAIALLWRWYRALGMGKETMGESAPQGVT